MEKTIVALHLSGYHADNWDYITLYSSIPCQNESTESRPTIHISAKRDSRSGVLHLAYHTFYKNIPVKGYVIEDTRA